MFFTAVSFVFYSLVSLIHTPHSTHMTVQIATKYTGAARMPKDKVSYVKLMLAHQPIFWVHLL